MIVDSEMIGRAQSSLRTSFIADALAMPVHWYYRTMDIQRAFDGGIQKFEAAPQFHPSSIMSLHSTSSGGRQSSRNAPAPKIVGEVILKGKAQHWDVPNVHYHQGMAAGENTLNAQCTRVLMRSMIANEHAYDKEAFVADYIAFMTAGTPLHNDTYAESYHRGFFANYVQGRAPLKCAMKTHDTASIGGLVTLAPLVFRLKLSGADISDIQVSCREHIALTHPDEELMRVSDRYVILLCSLMDNPDEDNLKILLAAAGKQHKSFDVAGLVKRDLPDQQVVGHIFSSACYISDSWPVVLYLAYKYRNEPFKGLLANTNLGGDNVHRGMVLGAIFGLLTNDIASQWFEKLVEHEAIGNEIDALISAAISPK
ncbi:ADP-ribosylglycohydrolase family protein [Glaciecola sp. SC05]|uniref:ADP-ribosylglycohydrolase family protein n=1 Tax=Glaciecola sp. SC05 TaxID=1987355 RepID=UPI003526D3AA